MAELRNTIEEVIKTAQGGKVAENVERLFESRMLVALASFRINDRLTKDERLEKLVTTFVGVTHDLQAVSEISKQAEGIILKKNDNTGSYFIIYLEDANFSSSEGITILDNNMSSESVNVISGNLECIREALDTSIFVEKEMSKGWFFTENEINPHVLLHAHGLYVGQ